ncbi:MAG: hypothetical protein IT462_05370 [Planctomycetes bacterium]|nr:hypothetical protein [Planctomycetota bacterium]
MTATLKHAKGDVQVTSSPSAILRDVAQTANAGYSQPADILVSLSEASLNAFLRKHYDKNSDFYDRSRSKQPDQPVYALEFDDHGIKRRIRFWAKVAHAQGREPIAIDLKQVAASNTRFRAWWKATKGNSPKATSKMPPNVRIDIPSIVLQVNFPKLDNPGNTSPAPEHQIDFDYSISAQCFVMVKRNVAGEDELTLHDWEITITPNNDPFTPDAANPVWGRPNQTCEADLKKLRVLVRDAFTMGANVALTDLAKKLALKLRLPPLNVISGIKIAPRELIVTDDAIALSANVHPTQLAAKAIEIYRTEMRSVFEGLSERQVSEILSNAPKEDKKRVEYFRQKLPGVARLNDKFTALSTGRAGTRKPDPLAATADLAVGISGNVFDVLAKEWLKVDVSECSPWDGVDIGVGYARGRGCYWFSLRNANGGLNGTTPFMGCDVAAGGQLNLEACLRDPCGDSHCATWNPGIGLRGPLKVELKVSTSSWDDNRCLKLSLHVDRFPGLEVYGLPEMVEDLVNAILNFISEIAFKAWVNALLTMFQVYIVEVPLRVPGTNVDVKLSRFTVGSSAGMLIVTGTITYS